MSKFHSLFESTQGHRAYFRAASAEPLEEASIAKMNRRAKAMSKHKPSVYDLAVHDAAAKGRPYDSLSAQEKKFVDRRVAADAKGFFDGYGNVKRTKEGPILLIDAVPLSIYWVMPMEGFVEGGFRLDLKPYLVGSSTVQYAVKDSDWVESEFDDSEEINAILEGAEEALAKGGLRALEQLIKDNIPSERKIRKAYSWYRERQRENEPNTYWDLGGGPRTYHR